MGRACGERETTPTGLTPRPTLPNRALQPYQINGEPFHDKDTVIRNLTLGRVEEWQVQIDANEMDSSNHPFHLHVNPFQVVGIGWNNASVMDIRLGEYVPNKEPPHGVRMGGCGWVPISWLCSLHHPQLPPHAALGCGGTRGIGLVAVEQYLHGPFGRWRDTLPVPGSQAPSGASLTLRFMPDTFTGRALLHCHMTPHIDLGMAAVAHIRTGP